MRHINRNLDQHHSRVRLTRTKIFGNTPQFHSVAEIEGAHRFYSLDSPLEHDTDGGVYRGTIGVVAVEFLGGDYCGVADGRGY